MRLPDGGAKLKAKLQDIQTLLNASRSTNSITNKVSELSLDEQPKVVYDNHTSVPPSNLLRAQHAEPERVSIRISVVISYMNISLI
jgi:hypothetical protein